jgi:rubrerythrin
MIGKQPRTLLEALLSMAYGLCGSDNGVPESSQGAARKRRAVIGLLRVVAHVDQGDLCRSVEHFASGAVRYDGTVEDALRGMAMDYDAIFHVCDHCMYRNLVEFWPADRPCPSCNRLEAAKS